MKNILLKSFTFITSLILLISLVSTSYAAQVGAETNYKTLEKMENLNNNEKKMINNHLEKLDINSAENNKELSKENLEIAENTLKNAEKHIMFADIINDEKSIILNTEKENTKVAITDDFVEVIETIDDNIFLINGEKHIFEIDLEDGFEDVLLDGDLTTQAANDGWVETGPKPGPWTVTSTKTANIQAQQALYTYTVSALTSIVATVIASKLELSQTNTIIVALAGALAGTFISNQVSSPVGKATIKSAKNGEPPLSDKRVETRSYAVHNGVDTFLETDIKYFSRCIGCGV